MPKRNDATYVYDVQSFKKIFPYIMPRKCDSLVFINFDLDLTKTLEFIRKNPSPTLGRKYRVFEVFIAAYIRLLVLRPELNRFIMNKRLWQRDEMSVNFIIKEDYTDEAPEHSIILRFKEDSSLEEIANNVNDKIVEIRHKNSSTHKNAVDKLVDFFTAFPPCILTTIASIVKYLDTKGIAPKSITGEDGLHCSAYISNLGSIGLKNATINHHLYQWGTTSLFIAIGELKRKRIVKNNSIEKQDTLRLGITIDERISDGFYFVKSLNIFQDILNSPEQLLEKASEVKQRPPKNRKEMKKRTEEEKLQHIV